MSSRSKMLIEDWFPLDMIGCEAMREVSTGQHPPPNRLHIWWARRPLVASRAVILASMLPTWSSNLARFLREREREILPISGRISEVVHRTMRNIRRSRGRSQAA